MFQIKGDQHFEESDTSDIHNMKAIVTAKTLYIKDKEHTFLNYSIQDKHLCKQN